jgi:hypothetical protein
MGQVLHHVMAAPPQPVSGEQFLLPARGFRGKIAQNPQKALE